MSEQCAAVVRSVLEEHAKSLVDTAHSWIDRITGSELSLGQLMLGLAAIKAVARELDELGMYPNERCILLLAVALLESGQAKFALVAS